MDKGSGLPLNELPWVFIDYWSGKMDEKLYIATFLAPNMGWLHDYKYLKEFEKLPSGSELRTLVNKRIGWEIISEYGFHARIGRTLEKTGSSLAHLDQEKLERVIAKYFCFRTCTAKDKETDKNLIDCIYLYRKFTSEAIRILLPVSILSGADRKPHSFVAALQLGLKRMFK